MNEQTNTDSICASCGNEASPGDPFCVFCGSDPLTGTTWDAKGGPEAILALIDRARGDDGLDALTLDEVDQLIVFHAYCIRAAEARAMSAVAADRGGFNVLARLGGKRRRARALNEAFAALVPNVGGLSATMEHIFSRASEETTPEELGMRYPGFAYVLNGSFVAYLEATGEAMLWDVFARYVQARAARLGIVVPEDWAPEDEAFRLSFNSLVYKPVPERAARHVVGRDARPDALPGGPDSSDGKLVVALVPSVWRGWFDLVLAPWATLGVYAQSDPLAGVEGEDAGTDELCAGYAAYIADRYEGEPTDVRPAQIAGRPAVRATVRLTAEKDPDDAFGLFQNVVVEHAWVRAGGRVWHLYGWAPARGRLQYLRALREAIDGFECAA